MNSGDIMSYIEDFNHRLNKSVKHDINNDQIYLDQITTCLRMTIQQATKWEKACIIGAGRCRDVPLTLFLDHYKQVTVTDVDTNSLKDCMKKRRNLTVKTVEYTGFQETEFFEVFGQRMWQASNEEEVNQFLTETIEKVRNYLFLPDDMGTYDFIYVSPIYTQLILQQCVHELDGLMKDGYSKKLANYMKERLLEEMPGIIERFNNNVIRLLDQDGVLFVLSDVFEMTKGSAFYRKVSLSIKNRDVMNEIYHNYHEQYGFGLGDYGLHDLSLKATRLRQRWLLWNFSNTRSFAIHLHIFKKSKGGTL